MVRASRAFLGNVYEEFYAPRTANAAVASGSGAASLSHLELEVKLDHVRSASCAH